MIPIIQSTTFKYDTSEDMGKLFDLEASGYFYTRLQNPTNDMVAAKIAALEGGSAAMLTSSGQAASFFSVFNIATHVADARTCVLHPASSTHRQLTDEELLAAGVGPDLIRLSVGIENIDDIIEDLSQALEQC